MERSGLRGGSLDEGPREDVLAAVLLHVVEAPSPVHLAFDDLADGEVRPVGTAACVTHLDDV